MAWLGFGLLLGLLFLGVNGYPKEDLITSLPGQPKVGFRHFSGYVDIDVKEGRSLFYYFAEAETDADKRPLTLWLNGGPGCSSVGGGAFTELGPFYPRGDGRSLRRNKFAWNKVSNILFVESPAGVGWSYSNNTNYYWGDHSVALDNRLFLLKWFKKFPEYKSRDLYLTGESYAGHYIPQLAIELLKYNNVSTGFKFSIKGVAIGNPLLQMDVDFFSTYQFFWSHGMISEEIYVAITNKCTFYDYTTECQELLYEAEKAVGDYIDYYDVILDVCYPSIVQQQLRLRKSATKISLGVDVCMEYEEDFYFNLPEVQKALHANRTNLPYPWSICSDIINYQSNDELTSILPALKTIIKSDIPLWIYSGDEDSVVPFLGTRTLLHELAQDLNFEITVPYTAWFSQGQVGGWTIEYGNKLTFATVRGASHMVPFAQPRRSFLLFDTFIHGKKLPNTTYPPIY